MPGMNYAMSQDDRGNVRPQPRPAEAPPVSHDRPGVKGAGPVGTPDSTLPTVRNPKQPWK